MGALLSVPSPVWRKGDLSQKLEAVGWLLVVIVLPGNPSPNGMEGQKRGHGKGRKVADQNPSRKTA